MGSVMAQYDDNPVQFQGSPCGIYGSESGNGQVSFEVLRFHPVHNNFINVSQSCGQTMGPLASEVRQRYNNLKPPQNSVGSSGRTF
jgi:hypothetical protein